MHINCYRLALSGLLLAGAGTAFGQVAPQAPGTPAPPAAPAPTPPAPPAPAKSVPYGAGMKINISPDGSKYLRFIGWNQVWAQYNENNSNTVRDGKPTFDQLAFSLRRTRFITLAQLNPRFMLLLDFGLESQSSVAGGAPGDPTGPGKKSQFYVHEAVSEYRVNKYLNFGAGLNIVNGISRMSSASTAQMLAYDIPVVNFPLVDQTDQFGFNLGVYGRGRINNFDYKVSVSDAFVNNVNYNPATVRTNVASLNPRNSNKIYQGYFSYSFLEKEANLLPFTTGTYLGTKKVLTVGGGFHYNAAGTISRQSAFPSPAPADPFTTTTTHDIKLFGADVFYDAPIDTASNTALTFYGVYYNYDFGPNYIRNVGLTNPGTGVVAGSGTDIGLRGNAVPLLGTGQSYYAQTGLLLPKKLLGPKARLQPYAAYQRNNLEGLQDGTSSDRRGVNIYDAGLNLLLDGHNAKITLNYRARPDFTDQFNLPSGKIQVNSVRYRPEVTMQFQVLL